MNPAPDPTPRHEERYAALEALVRITHRLGLYDDCPECRIGGHE